MKRGREKIVQIVSLNNAATLRNTHAVLERRRGKRPFHAPVISSLASMFPMPLSRPPTQPPNAFCSISP
jgi:hypothetical protein